MKDNPLDKKSEYNAFQLDLDTYFKIVKLAKAKGKKPGDSMEEELIEIMRANPKKIKSIGKTDKDLDILAGDLRENGLKILNLNEIQRRKNNKKD